MKIKKTERKFALLENKKRHFESAFKFISEHNGFRKGKLHLLLADTGSGKSTLIRSLMYDVLTSIPEDRKLLLILSEETETDFAIEIERSGFPDNLLEKLVIISEMEISNQRIFCQEIVLALHPEKNVDFVMFDNITTSQIYMGEVPSKQADVAKWLKNIAITRDIPFLVVAHTNNIIKSNKRLINATEIRGSKVITLIAEFLYILNSFEIQNNIYKLLEVNKHRGQTVSNIYFKLLFSKNQGVYAGDDILDYEKVKLLFKDKNVY